MRRRPIIRDVLAVGGWVACLFLVVGLSASGPFGALGAPPALSGERRAEAIERYGRLSGRCSEWLSHQARGGDGQNLRARRDDIAAGLEQLITDFPQTDFAAHAMRDLMSLYSASGDALATHRAYERIVKEFPRTSHEMDAHIFMAIESQNRHQASDRAIEYFSKIPDPRETPYRLLRANGKPWPSKDGEMTPEESYYVNSRLKMVKCCLQLNRLAEADKITADLREGFPKAAQWVDRTVGLYRGEIFGTTAEGLPTVEDVDRAVTDRLVDEKLGSMSGGSPEAVSVVAGDDQAEPSAEKPAASVADRANGQTAQGGHAEAAEKRPVRSVTGVFLLVCGVACIVLGLSGILRRGKGHV